jgi:hypothetical protein
MGPAFAWAMAEAASAHQAASATHEDTSQQRAGSRRRSSADPQRAQQGATAAADAAPAALDSLSRLQRLADASPQVAQLRRLQALADASPRVAQMRRLQALADASPQAAQMRRLQALADGRSAPVAQLAGGPEEEELVHGKFASAKLQPQLQQAPRGNNTGLPDQLKSGIESLSGLSMDDVRVHYNSAQPAQLNALAYAQGNDIHLGPGQEQHLPHEAWHVVQQAQGRVRPTMQMAGGVAVNDDVGLEREADVMGTKALERGHRADETHRSISMPFETAQQIEGSTTNGPDVNVVNNDSAPLANGRGLAQRGGNEMQRIADHRPEAALQRQVQAWGEGSEQVGQLRAWQGVADGRGVGGQRQDLSLSFVKGGVSLNDHIGLEKEADMMGLKALSASLTNNLFATEAERRGSIQLKSTTSRPIMQRWIKMAPDQKLSEDKMEDAIKKTSALFEGRSKKPKDGSFVLLSNLEETKKKVENALDFLKIKHKRGEQEYVTITDVEPMLVSWMGIVPDYNQENVYDTEAKKTVKDAMIGEVLGPNEDPEQYDIRAAAGIPAEMRYYVTFEELAWALVQACGFQAALDLSDDYDAEIAVAKSVSISENVLKNLQTALDRIFDKIGKITIECMTGIPDYASFHKINSWEDFKKNYEEKYKPKSFVGLITFLHDIKSYFAISKNDILSKKPDEIVVHGTKKAIDSKKNGDLSRNFPEKLKINKEDMRYNLGTVDEADPFVLFMRERGRSVWAAPSFTTVSMLEIVKRCSGTPDELTSVAYGIFAFWCIHYPQTATPIHTFHEVMAAAQAYGVAYDPDKSVVSNANNESLLKRRY